MRRPTLQAQTILTDATTIATLIAPALANLDLGLAGWPSTTPGASPTEATPSQECPRRDCTNERPCYEHGDGVILTSTERLGLAPDKARIDLEALQEALRTMAHLGAVAATICARWGYNGIPDSTVKARLIAIDSGIWCTNCGRHGFKAPKLEGKTECSFCADFRRHYNRPAPKEVLDIRSYRRLSVQDIERTLDKLDPNWRKKQKKASAA